MSVLFSAPFTLELTRTQIPVLEGDPDHAFTQFFLQQYPQVVTEYFQTTSEEPASEDGESVGQQLMALFGVLQWLSKEACRDNSSHHKSANHLVVFFQPPFPPCTQNVRLDV